MLQIQWAIRVTNSGSTFCSSLSKCQDFKDDTISPFRNEIGKDEYPAFFTMDWIARTPICVLSLMSSMLFTWMPLNETVFSSNSDKNHYHRKSLLAEDHLKLQCNHFTSLSCALRNCFKFVLCSSTLNFRRVVRTQLHSPFFFQHEAISIPRSFFLSLALSFSLVFRFL